MNLEFPAYFKKKKLLLIYSLFKPDKIERIMYILNTDFKCFLEIAKLTYAILGQVNYEGKYIF